MIEVARTVRGPTNRRAVLTLVIHHGIEFKSLQSVHVTLGHRVIQLLSSNGEATLKSTQYHLKEYRNLLGRIPQGCILNRTNEYPQNFSLLNRSVRNCYRHLDSICQPPSCFLPPIKTPNLTDSRQVVPLIHETFEYQHKPSSPSQMTNPASTIQRTTVTCVPVEKTRTMAPRCASVYNLTTRPTLIPHPREARETHLGVF